MCVKTPNTEHKLSDEKEKDPIASKIDTSSVAWKLKKKYNLILFVIRHIPREIPHFAYFYGLWHARGRGCSVTRIQDIIKGRLEIILRARFTIAEQKCEYIHYQKELI